MQNLSLQEFKTMLKLASPQQFIFSSENQNCDRTKHTIDVKLTFTTVIIAFNPNSIFFKNSTDSICINRVKRIHILDNESTLGTIFTIICGDRDNDFNDIGYTMIAR